MNASYDDFQVFQALLNKYYMGYEKLKQPLSKNFRMLFL